MIEIPKMIAKNIPIEDEWGTKATCKKIMNVNEPVIIKAKFAGRGKSYMGEYVFNVNKSALFVMPNYRQLQENKCEGLEATTYNKFFSIAVGEENYLSLIIQVLSAIFSPAGICSVVSGVLPQEAGPGGVQPGVGLKRVGA